MQMQIKNTYECTLQFSALWKSSSTKFPEDKAFAIILLISAGYIINYRPEFNKNKDFKKRQSRLLPKTRRMFASFNNFTLYEKLSEKKHR